MRVGGIGHALYGERTQCASPEADAAARSEPRRCREGAVRERTALCAPWPLLLLEFGFTA
jgi:hypothetical protein